MAGAHTGTTRAQDAGVPDPAVEWIRDNGWTTQHFASACVSRAGDGSEIWDEPLPVGNGRWLDCSTNGGPGYATLDFQADSDEIWCALGYVTEAWPKAADADLAARLTVNRYYTPWALQVTASQATTVSTASFFGGRVWPLWVEAYYATTELAPAAPGLTCDQLFGLTSAP